MRKVTIEIDDELYDLIEDTVELKKKSDDLIKMIRKAKQNQKNSKEENEKLTQC